MFPAQVTSNNEYYLDLCLIKLEHNNTFITLVFLFTNITTNNKQTMAKHGSEIGNLL